MIRNNFRYLPKDEAQPRNTSHWSVDENYNRTREEVFPVRATSTADNLYLTLHSPANDVNPACAQQKGFKILFHHPAEIPTSSTDYIVLARDEAYNIKLIPDVTVTASTLINYEPHKRGCFFSHEKTLKFYKTYTERNCKLECLANYTLQHCKCVSYYLPNDGKTTICGLLDHACEDTAEDDLLHLDMESEISATDGTKSGLPFCDCLPLCTSIVYNADITQSHNYDINVNVAFKDTKFTIRERNELFSNTDFWASCGGLFGLFTGFSVISLAEIIYYLSLRWVCNIWSFRKRFWFL
ncbi:pickpocket protein 28-like [Tenebrio molitor]|uniref:pickpocket protein 28-like n=1 Tax=Tenebrio molitor TaxID=7067 RepID=UPI003624A8A8